MVSFELAFDNFCLHCFEGVPNWCQITVKFITNMDLPKGRRVYTIEFKRKVLASLSVNNGNISLTAREYGLTWTHIQGWNQQSADILGVKRKAPGDDCGGDCSPSNTGGALLFLILLIMFHLAMPGREELGAARQCINCH